MSINSNKNKQVCTIYLLTNKVNGKIYIGQTWLSLIKRMGRDGRNYSNSTYLFNAINKYGYKNFEYTILAECQDQTKADELESEFIKKYNSRDVKIGYNIKEGGSAGRHSEETKLKISMNASKPWLGKHLSDEIKKKISEANTGNLHTEEWKENNSKMMIERHKTQGHPMQGKHHTEESKLKISESGKGRKHSLKSVKQRAEKRKMPKEKELAIVQAYQNNVPIKEMNKIFNTKSSSIYRVLYRNNIELHGQANTPHSKHTEETKKKQAVARKRYWENKKAVG